MQTIGIASDSLRLAAQHTNGTNEDEQFIDTLSLTETQRQEIRSRLSHSSGEIDPVISHLVGATNGILYKHLVGSLDTYPIPQLPMPSSNGELFFDVGCSWGRWSIAAGRKGFFPIGMDPSLGAVLAAKRLTEKFGLPFFGVVADARFIPFRDSVFGAAFSYSVLQHFSNDDAIKSLRELNRILQKDGKLLVQMASSWGLRSLQQQLLRGFATPQEFDVRYRNPIKLNNMFRDIFGETEISADCYFGLGLQAADLPVMPRGKRIVINLSEYIKKLSNKLPILTYVADSLYIRTGF